MHMAAGKPDRLLAFQKLAHGAAADVTAEGGPVQRRAKRRTVADENQRLQPGEPLQVRRDLFFRVFAGRVEWRGRGVAEPGDAPAIGVEVSSMQRVQAVPAAEGFDVRLVLVVAGQHPHPRCPALQHRRQSVQATAPAHQVAGGDIDVRLLRHQRLERRPVAVDVGKDKDPHDPFHSKRRGMTMRAGIGPRRARVQQTRGAFRKPLIH